MPHQMEPNVNNAMGVLRQWWKRSMSPLHRTVMSPVAVALLALALGYACGDDAPPAVHRSHDA